MADDFDPRVPDAETLSGSLVTRLRNLPHHQMPVPEHSEYPRLDRAENAVTVDHDFGLDCPNGLCLWSGHGLCPGLDLAGEVKGATISKETNVLYPESPAIINVTKAPYFAKGDGVTDDTDAIQKALSDTMGLHRMLYFPNGTYLISKTLNWSKKNADGRDAWGKNFLQGQNAHRTIFRLKDGTFTNTEKPASIMWCGGFGSADWFHNYVQDITFDVGNNNPGAIGLQFYSNNSGAVRNCRFIASENSGTIGLDLGHRDMNGPLLVRNCEVKGFLRGIKTANAVNGQTFEHITLKGQREIAIDNEGQSISIRGLLSQNAVPAVRSYGSCCLVDAQLSGQSGAEKWPAVINYNGGSIFLRDVQTTGYSRALGDVSTPDWFAATRISGEDKRGSLGPNINEYSSAKATNAFAAKERLKSGSLRLAVKEPPEIPADDPATWANVDDFGADPTGNQDSSAAIQKAIDSGATTVFLPGFYALKSTVLIRGNVRRLIGVGGWIDYTHQAQPDFRVLDGTSSALSIEHFSYIHGGIEIDSSRTVIFHSVADCDLTFTDKAETGELYFEDFVTHDLKLKRQKVWARQLNVENEGTHVVNDASQLWVLGYKTERGGTLLETRNNGRSEILGGFSYTTTAGKLAPMFVTEDSSVFTWFNEVCFNDDPFETIIQETRNGKSKTIKRGEGTAMPYVSSHAKTSHGEE